MIFFRFPAFWGRVFIQFHQPANQEQLEGKITQAKEELVKAEAIDESIGMWIVENWQFKKLLNHRLEVREPIGSLFDGYSTWLLYTLPIFFHVPLMLFLYISYCCNWLDCQQQFTKTVSHYVFIGFGGVMLARLRFSETSSGYSIFIYIKWNDTLEIRTTCTILKMFWNGLVFPFKHG